MNIGTESTEALDIFYSYASTPKDTELLEQLLIHLSYLKRQAKIAGWYKRDILAGTEWAREIDTHLNIARIVLLFISPDFMNSDYCYGIEMQRAMERHERQEARVIPILLRPVDWENAPFSKLESLPSGGKPITKWGNRDQVYSHIAIEIRKVVDNLTKSSPPENPVLRKATNTLGKIVPEEQRDAAKHIIEALRDLSFRCKKVNELKCVHNMLHDLEVALEPLVIQLKIYRKGVEKEEALDFRRIIECSWEKVPPKIVKLQYFASQEMGFLEEKETPFTFMVNGDQIKITGPKWVTKFVPLQINFKRRLEEQTTLKDINELSEISNSLLDLCRDHLIEIDKRLLQEVDQLNKLSDQILRSTSYDWPRA